MYQVRCHGRGGFGVKTTAHVLGKIAFLSGYQTQDFALYGAERRGAPLTSFTRYDKKTILERGYIFEPDAVIILDEHLNFAVMLKGLKKNSFVLINSKKPASYFKKRYKIKQKIYCLDATEIAIKNLGKPLPNIAILGAFIKLSKLPEKNLELAIKEQMEEVHHPEAISGNIKAAKECMKLIK
jgi:pyruvate ferredoxin oxidoreductase gamma subunit